jgi:hypothetical protein
MQGRRGASYKNLLRAKKLTDLWPATA